MVDSMTPSISPGAPASEDDAAIIPGVSVHPLIAHSDGRGSVTEVFRSSWASAPIRQWTVMTLGRRVVRGPSVHRTHADAVVGLAGDLQIGLRDLRERSPGFRLASRVTLSERRPALLWIPPGVMHAFYAAMDTIVVLVGSTHEYDPDDDIKCRWQDAPLDLDASVVGTSDERALMLEDVIVALRT